MFLITENHFLFVALFDWGNDETQKFPQYPRIGTVLHWGNPKLENQVTSHP